VASQSEGLSPQSERYCRPPKLSPTNGSGSPTDTSSIGPTEKQTVVNCDHGLANVRNLIGAGPTRQGASLRRLSVNRAIPVAFAALLCGSLITACGSSHAGVSSPTATAVASCAKGTTRPHPISAGTPRIVAQWKPPIPNTARNRMMALPPVTKYVGQLNGRNQYCISSYSTGVTDSGGPLVEIYVYPGTSGAEVRALVNLMKHSDRFQTVRVTGSAD